MTDRPSSRCCILEEMAEEAATSLDKGLDEVDSTTDALGEFWQHMTEECVLRLVRFKPEMVRHYGPEVAS